MVKRFVFVFLMITLIVSSIMAAELPVPILETDGLRYYNGGVGVDERRALIQVFPLKLVFVEAIGAYVNKVQVTIGGENLPEVVVNADQGPWLFLDLEPGHYTIKAEYQDREHRVAVDLQSGEKKVLFLYW